jgi:hypothetical protein
MVNPSHALPSNQVDQRQRRHDVLPIMTAMNLVRAAALGAAAMYLLDPDRGRRRRAVARDKARSTVHQSGQFLSAASSDARARLQGLRAMTRRIASGRPSTPDDAVLVARVRARLGRLVAHPHAVNVTADDGNVRVSGPILKSEHTPLVAGVRLVRGVRSVDDRDLVLHDTPDGVPALQGEGRHGRMRSAPPAEWTPAVRLSAIAGGGALALYGLSCSGLSRLALSTAGLALVARGGFNVPMGHLLAGAGSAVSRLGQREAYIEHTDTSDDWSDAATRDDAMNAGEARSTASRASGSTRQRRTASAVPTSTYAAGTNQYLQQGGSPTRTAGQQQQSMGGSAQAAQGGAARARSKATQEGDLGVGGPGAGAQYAYPSTARESSQQDGAPGMGAPA